jgi:toxin CcdB
MAQFSVHKNKNPQTKGYAPFLLDIQHPLVSHLEMRVAVPLVDQSRRDSEGFKKLTPTCEIAGVTYLIVVPLLAAIPQSQLGAQVADLSAQRNEILAAIDMMISGI